MCFHVEIWRIHDLAKSCCEIFRTRPDEKRGLSRNPTNIVAIGDAYDTRAPVHIKEQNITTYTYDLCIYYLVTMHVYLFVYVNKSSLGGNIPSHSNLLPCFYTSLLLVVQVDVQP